MIQRRDNHLWILAMALPLLVSGCAGLRGVKPDSAPTEQTSQQRQAAMIADFEKRRDQAQLEAALNRWREGNAAACEQGLRQLVESRPEFVEARVQLGEWLLMQEDMAGARAQIMEALRLNPNHAAAHHSLGLVLEATGEAGEAQGAFQRALELEPENGLYQLSAQSDAARSR